MTVYNLTQCPTSVQVSLIANTGLFPSPLIASAQTVDRQGLKWKLVYGFDNLATDERGAMLGLIAILRGQANRLMVDVHDNPARGAAGGSPVVAGAGQTGGTLNLSGATPSVTDWIMAGDYFSVVVNGLPELKMATANATSSGGGTLTVTFNPRLRASPVDGAIVRVEPQAIPRGVFVLENPEAGWSSFPGGAMGPKSSLTLSLIEDVFATQA